MELTDVERQILYNQSLILSFLDKDNAYAEHDQNMKILESGYSMFYEEVVHMYDNTHTDDDCKLVVNILHMFRHLYYSLQELDNPDEELVRKLTFSGFDGHTKYYGFARFLIKDRNKWTEFKNSELDSHGSPGIDTYISLLSAYNELCDTGGLGRVIPEESLKKIADSYYY